MNNKIRKVHLSIVFGIFFSFQNDAIALYNGKMSLSHLSLPYEQVTRFPNLDQLHTQTPKRNTWRAEVCDVKRQLQFKNQ